MDDLRNECRTARVAINPQVAGTGLKIKCVEALTAGCAIVMNQAGADGQGKPSSLPGAGRSLHSMSCKSSLRMFFGESSSRKQYDSPTDWSPWRPRLQSLARRSLMRLVKNGLASLPEEATLIRSASSEVRGDAPFCA